MTSQDTKPPGSDLAKFDAFTTRLYAEHGSVLLRYLSRLTRDRSQAEDILQETLLRSWLNASRLVLDDAAIRSWLFRVAHNLAVDEQRRRRSRPVELWPDAGVDTAVAGATDGLLTRLALAGAIQDLRPEHQCVLVEVYYRGRTVNEAAAVLEIPAGTVKSRLYYGLRHLRRSLAAGEEDPTWRHR